MGLLDNILGTIQNTFSIGKGTNEVGLRTDSGTLQGKNNSGEWQDILGQYDISTKSIVDVYRTTTQNITGGVITKVLFTTVDRDTQSEFSTSNSRFVSNRDQEVHIAANLCLSGFPTLLNIIPYTIDIYVYLNGSQFIHTGTSSGNQGTGCPNINTYLSLSSGDYVEIYVSHGNGSNQRQLDSAIFQVRTIY